MGHWCKVGVISIDCSLSDAEAKEYEKYDQPWDEMYPKGLQCDEMLEAQMATRLLHLDAWLAKKSEGWSTLHDPKTIGTIKVGNEDDDLITGNTHMDFYERRYELSQRQEARMGGYQYFGNPKQVSSVKSREGPSSAWKWTMFKRASERMRPDWQHGRGQVRIEIGDDA